MSIKSINFIATITVIELFLVQCIVLQQLQELATAELTTPNRDY